MKGIHFDIAGLVLIVPLCFPCAVRAEKVYLKSGRIIEGKILEDTDRKIRLDIGNEIRSISKKYIVRIGDERPPPTVFETPPAFYLEKMNQIPDFIQRNVGKSYCVPTSVSNGLMWYDDYGYDDLVPNSGDRRKDQWDLVLKLSSKGLMNTSANEGTFTRDAINTIHHYITSRGYSIKRMEYYGWYKRPRRFLKGDSIPDLDTVKHGMLGYGMVWLIVGSYKSNPKDNSYHRLAGHWVTLVGYGKNKRGEPDPSSLIVHNSARGLGFSFSNDYIRAVPIHSGTLTGKGSGLPRSAAGFYRLVGNLGIHPKADTAILDGAVILELE